jgi:DNA-binding PadR family transcriptional regulator
MYRDKTLIPTEALRLLALGLLADAPRRYKDLATEVRHFTSHITGPSLDLLGPSIELLRYEGLTEPADEAEGADLLLRITDAGREELAMLLHANVRAPIDGFAKLVIALKFRFLHLLPAPAQAEVLDGLIELYQAEHARLVELRAASGARDRLAAWLDHDLGQIDDRIAWLEAQRHALANAA